MKNSNIFFVVLAILNVNKQQFCTARPEDGPNVVQPIQNITQQVTLDWIFFLFWFFKLHFVSKQENLLGSRFDGDADETILTDELNEDIDLNVATKKCGIPNQMGLNKHGLEFLSSSHSKAGKKNQNTC